jgi:hypothetical protein
MTRRFVRAGTPVIDHSQEERMSKSSTIILRERPVILAFE